MKKRPHKVRARKARRVRPACTAEFVLPAQCTLAAASELKLSLAKLLQQSQPLTVHHSSVERIDTAALQLLTAFTRERRKLGHTVEWAASASSPFAQAACLLGLDTVLELPGGAS